MRVVIGEGSHAYRLALRTVLDEEDDLTCVGAAGNVDELLAIAEQNRPDVAVVDVHLPPGGIEAVALGLDRANVSCRLIALTAMPSAAAFITALRAGASGLIAKTDGPEILSALRASTE